MGGRRAHYYIKINESVWFMKRFLTSIILSIVFVVSGCDDDKSACNGYVCRSKVSDRYLETTDGKTYIPIGMNICFPRFLKEEEAVLADYEKKFAQLQKNGGNWTRIWLSHPFFEIEEKEGVYNLKKLKRIDRIFDLADKYGIRLKLCFEHFTKLIDEKPMFNFAAAVPFDKRMYHKKYGGSFASLEEFFSSEKGKQVYLNRVRVFAERYKNRKCVFAWEIWNESDGIWVEDEMKIKWNSEIFAELKKMFPNHMTVMNLTSYDRPLMLKRYKTMNVDPQNDVTQVHNYINEGDSLPIAKSPTDVMAHQGIVDMLKLTPNKPVLFDEIGAASPNHVSGPHKGYEIDKNGVFILDQTFVPFFSGACGTGMSWHWEYYIQKHNLFYMYSRFNKAIEGLDPIKENFKPYFFETENMRVYVLDGKSTMIAYCRDKNNSWITELKHRQEAKPLLNEKVSFAKFVPNAEKAEIYQPTTDKSMVVNCENSNLVLPEFLRATVVRIKK